MESSSIPLAIAAALFLAVLSWRVRPALGLGARKGESREQVRAHLARAAAAKDEAERAAALCDAAELVGPIGARGLYLRALRADPASPRVVERVVAGLGKRPRALEAALWRHLAAAPWAGRRAAATLALGALEELYEGPLRNAVRARFVANARASLAA